jgi:hypothetical protein
MHLRSADRAGQPLDRRRRVAALGSIRLDGGGRVRNLPGADAARRSVERVRQGTDRCPIRPSKRSAWVAYSCSTSRSRSRSPCVMRARCARSIAASAGTKGGAATVAPRAISISARACFSASSAIFASRRLFVPLASRVWHGGVKARVNGGSSTMPMVKTVLAATACRTEPGRRYPRPGPPQLTKSTPVEIASGQPIWPQTGRNMAEKSHSA